MRTHSVLIAGGILGLGIGGFFDGIVLHQILQWHHMICVTAHCQAQTLEQAKVQARQDGYFHLGVLILTIVGSYRIFRSAGLPDAPRSSGAFIGSVLCGWGVFNFVEGLIDHQLLGVHHVLPGSPHWFAADMAFLASGVVFFLAGWSMLPRAPVQRVRAYA